LPGTREGKNRLYDTDKSCPKKLEFALSFFDRGKGKKSLKTTKGEKEKGCRII